MALHHLTLWVPDLPRAESSWGWLLERLGFERGRSWATGCIWRQDRFRLVLEQSPDMVPGMLHSRLRPGMNHLAFDLDSAAEVDAVAREAVEHGWRPMGADGPRHSLASDAHAAYLEDADGFEVELVAQP